MKENEDTIKFVERVMSFVVKNSNYGPVNHPLVDTFNRIPIEQLKVDEFLALFSDKKANTICALSATIMTKILLENNIPAYIYDFGLKNTSLTHVIVLVKHKNDFLIFDPYFNAKLEKKNGCPLLFSEAIKLIKTSYFNDSTVIVSNPVEINFTVPKNIFENTDTNYIEKECLLTSIEFHTDKNGNYSKKKDLCFLCDKRDVCFSFINEFEKGISIQHNKNYTFYEGIQFKINKVYGASDHSFIDTYINSILSDTFDSIK